MTHFALSKPYLDVGIFTNQGEAMREFYSRDVGIELIDTIEIEEGYLLYRYDANGSALKINDLRQPMKPARTGFRRVIVPRADLASPVELSDPDGMPVLLVPPGHLDITQLGVVWAVPSIEPAREFAERSMGAQSLGDGRYRFGETTILFEEDPDLPRSGAMESVGFTYTTFHVRDVLGAHAHLLASGCQEAIPPTPFHGITTYSFIRDPFGNWVEVSQRADLVGSFAEVDGPILSQEEIRSIRQRD
jgi:lactoylglutathione lyase